MCVSCWVRVCALAPSAPSPQLVTAYTVYKPKFINHPILTTFCGLCPLVDTPYPPRVDNHRTQSVVNGNMYMWVIFDMGTTILRVLYPPKLTLIPF